MLLNLSKHPVLRGVLTSSGILALLGMGDALLYSVLPVYGDSLGFTVFEIGTLLSINRLIRIPTNTIVANLVASLGYKTSLFLSTLLAIVTTAMYGLEGDFILMLLARMTWGLTFSALRVCGLSYAAESENSKAFMFGLNASIKTMGKVIALIIGPLFISYYDVRITFLILATLGLVAFPLILTLPKTVVIYKQKVSYNIFTGNELNALVFLLAFIIDGVVVVSLSSLFLYLPEDKRILIVGQYLLIKNTSLIFMPLVSGWLEHYLKPKSIFKLLIFCIIISLLFIANDVVVFGLVGLFLCNSYMVVILPTLSIENNEGHKLATLSVMSTWWDVGAASGALLGLTFVQLLGVSQTYYILSALLFLESCALFMRKGQR